MKKIFSLLLIIISLIVFAPKLKSVQAQSVGTTTVAKWKDNKEAAFSLNFDDSRPSHADIAIPELTKRGLVGTFFVNPGGSWFRSRQSIWENPTTAANHEFANHSWTHTGASDYNDADFEIGETARWIWARRPATASKLQAFAAGGGTSWDISDAQMTELKNKYFVFNRRSSSSTNLDDSAMISKAQSALSSGSWDAIHFHSLGTNTAPDNDYLGNDKADVLAFFDYLATVKDRLWVGGWIAVHKYEQERNTASISIQSATNDAIQLNLSSTKDPVLYDEPLTLLTTIHSTWTSCSAKQGTTTYPCKIVSGKAQYNAIPGKGSVVLTKTGSTAPPSTSSPTASPTASPNQVAGDANGDGKVNGVDYSIWLKNYGLNLSGSSNGDFDNNGSVTGLDYAIWLSNYSI
jgi:hypothetical protein